MIGPERLAAGERAETTGDYLVAAAAYRAVTAVQDEALAAQAYFCLGRVSWRQSRFDASLTAFESALALATSLGDDELIARIENGIGIVHYARGEFKLARRYYTAALARTNDDAMRGRTILNLGVIENIESRFTSARERYDEAYRLLSAHGDIPNATLALQNMGMIEADLGLWDEADASFTKALQLATEAGIREMIAKILVNRAEVLVERDQFGDAIEQCDRALDIYAVVGDEMGRGEALRWKALGLEGIGQFPLAERVASEALHIAVRCGARLLEAEAARHVGTLRGRLGDRIGGRKQLQRALDLFGELNATREASEVASLLRNATPLRPMPVVKDDRSVGPDAFDDEVPAGSARSSRTR